MKYQGYEIQKEKTDLGEEKESLNRVYNITKNGKWIATALTLETAKEFIKVLIETGDIKKANLYL